MPDHQPSSQPVSSIPPHSRIESGRKRWLHWGVVTLIGSYWAMSAAVYYFGLPIFGIVPNYNTDSIAISIYYLFWVGLTVISFWPIYASWPSHSPWPAFSNRLASATIWVALFFAGSAFAGYVMPTLSPVHWPASLGQAPDLIMASERYFLPKSLEILLQQLLVLALVLFLAGEGFALLPLSLLCAGLFGGMHILLVLGGMPFSAIVHFALTAAIFGMILPWLILRVRYGFAASYSIHWLYYALTIYLSRTFG